MSRFVPWIVGLMVLAIVVVQPLSAEVVKPGFTLDGHWWQKQSKEAKFATVLNMVDAATYGYLNGYERGLEEAAKQAPNQKSQILGLKDKFKPVKFSHTITSYASVVDMYYSTTKHFEIPLVYVITCMADQTLSDPTCKPYGAGRPLPTPVPSQ